MSFRRSQSFVSHTGNSRQISISINIKCQQTISTDPSEIRRNILEKKREQDDATFHGQIEN